MDLTACTPKRADAMARVPLTRLIAACLLTCFTLPLVAGGIQVGDYLKASNTDAGDSFGHSIDLSGQTLVVGAPMEDSAATGVGGNPLDDSAFAAGAVYVLTSDGTGWTHQAYLKASNTDPGDLFGEAVDLSGDTLAVTAVGEDSAATGVGGNQADNTAASSGAAYVFVRDGLGAWSQQAYLKASNTGSVDNFGFSVALDGDLLVVGADDEDSAATGVDGNGADDSANGAGAAYVFERVGSTWSQVAYLKASNTGAGDVFGWSVAVSGDTVAVGARLEDSDETGVGGGGLDDDAPNAGAVYVFTRDGLGTWSQQAYIKAGNTDAGDLFGWSLALSGDTLVVGAPGEDGGSPGPGADPDDDTASNAGAAYVFVRNAGIWTQQAYLKAFNPDNADGFGRSVALFEETLVVGADGEESAGTGVSANPADNSAPASGAAYVFTRDGTAWSQSAYLKASNTGTLDHFGWDSAVHGATIVASAPDEDSIDSGTGGDGNDDFADGAGAVYGFIIEGAVDLLFADRFEN
jgi:hypothetical protein